MRIEDFYLGLGARSGKSLVQTPYQLLSVSGSSWHKDYLPKKYIINKKATILFWGDGTKTVVKRCADDKHDKKIAFLIAYFQKQSGLSKNKANKYLNELFEEEK